MGKALPPPAVRKKVRNADLVERLQWAARHLHARHDIGDLALVSAALESIGGAYSRFMVFEMMLKYVPDPAQAQALQSSLILDMLHAVPLSRRRDREVVDLAERYLSSSATG